MQPLPQVNAASDTLRYADLKALLDSVCPPSRSPFLVGKGFSASSFAPVLAILAHKACINFLRERKADFSADTFLRNALRISPISSVRSRSSRTNVPSEFQIISSVRWVFFRSRVFFRDSRSRRMCRSACFFVAFSGIIIVISAIMGDTGWRNYFLPFHLSILGESLIDCGQIPSREIPISANSIERTLGSRITRRRGDAGGNNGGGREMDGDEGGSPSPRPGRWITDVFGISSSPGLHSSRESHSKLRVSRLSTSLSQRIAMLPRGIKRK